MRLGLRDGWDRYWRADNARAVDLIVTRT